MVCSLGAPLDLTRLRLVSEVPMGDRQSIDVRQMDWAGQRKRTHSHFACSASRTAIVRRSAHAYEIGATHGPWLVNDPCRSRSSIQMVGVTGVTGVQRTVQSRRSAINRL
jgi:hypothetical protein